MHPTLTSVPRPHRVTRDTIYAILASPAKTPQLATPIRAYDGRERCAQHVSPSAHRRFAQRQSVRQSAADAWPLVDEAGVELEQRRARIEQPLRIVHCEDAAATDDWQPSLGPFRQQAHHRDGARVQWPPAQPARLIA